MSKIGVDLSQYNSISDFVKAKNAGLEFVILRAVSTNNKGIYIDTKFESQYKACKTAGISVGVYMYTYAKSINQLKNEIAMLDKAIKGKTFEYPIILDIEDPMLNKSSLKSVNTENVKYFCNYYEKKGYYAMFYSMPGFYGTSLNMNSLKDYDFWLAHWTLSTSKPSKHINAYGNTGIWQYTSSGSFTGIGKAGAGLDVNVSYKDYPSIIKGLGLNGFQKDSSSNLGGNVESKGEEDMQIGKYPNILISALPRLQENAEYQRAIRMFMRRFFPNGKNGAGYNPLITYSGIFDYEGLDTSKYEIYGFGTEGHSSKVKNLFKGDTGKEVLENVNELLKLSVDDIREKTKIK